MGERFDVADARQVLERTPPALAGLLRGIDPAWSEGRPAPHAWSPLEIVGHLIHGELDDWIPRARIILDRGEAEPFPPFDREGYRRLVEGRAIDELLEELTLRRRESLAALDGLALRAADLDRRGTHPELGPVTLGQLIATWAAHDLAHFEHAAEVMAKRYREAVGPWIAYLPSLERPD